MSEANPMESDATADAIRCDFCGEEALSVRRVALDGDYDRLQKKHEVLYACSPCSEKKERQSLGLVRGAGRG